MTNDEKFLQNITMGLIKISREVEKLEMENARYRKALEKYANPETHSMDEDGEVWYGDYFDYKTARDALEGKE